MRGEHPNLRVVFVDYQGSSPHARGALHLLRPSHQRDGIIPACAGSTTFEQSSKDGA